MQAQPQTGIGVAGEIRQRILGYEYPPGTLLSIRKLAQELQVSTTPIREALLRLEAEGLVDRSPNNSARVAAITYRDYQDILPLRLVLARQSAQLAAQRISPAELAECGDLLARLRQVEDFQSVNSIDLQMHSILYAATRNQFLQHAFVYIRFQATYAYGLRAQQKVLADQICEEWDAILEAIRASDGQRAADLIEFHVQRSVQELQRLTRVS